MQPDTRPGEAQPLIRAPSQPPSWLRCSPAFPRGGRTGQPSMWGRRRGKLALWLTKEAPCQVLRRPSRRTPRGQRREAGAYTQQLSGPSLLFLPCHPLLLAPFPPVGHSCEAPEPNTWELMGETGKFYHSAHPAPQVSITVCLAHDSAHTVVCTGSTSFQHVHMVRMPTDGCSFVFLFILSLSFFGGRG